MQRPTTASITLVVRRDGQGICRDPDHIGIAGIGQRRQRRVDLRFSTKNRQVARTNAAGTDGGSPRKRHGQRPVGDLQTRGQIGAAVIYIGNTDPAD